MTRRELNLAIFEGTANSVLWQPRLETWIGHHMAKGTLPERFRGLDVLGIYDALRCSVRYGGSGYYMGAIDHYEEPADATRHGEQQGDRYVSTITLPSGSLRTVERDIWRNGELVNRRIEKYPVSSAEDLGVLTELVERQQHRANPKQFSELATHMGERGEPTVGLSSSGFTDLIKSWSGLAGTFYLLADCPDEVEAYLEACDRRDQRMVRAALELPCRIFNLGDHATNEFTPPPILKKYMLPRWQWISERLHRHGRFVHSHWDGHSKAILPYLPDTGLDSIEALTPEPMGDITLEEIKAAVSDRIVCLDLLPAIDFLQSHPTQELLDFTRRVIDTFAPRLILGISDEISQIGQIEKVEAVSELVDSICGLAD